MRTQGDSDAAKAGPFKSAGPAGWETLAYPGLGPAEGGLRAGVAAAEERLDSAVGVTPAVRKLAAIWRWSWTLAGA